MPTEFYEQLSRDFTELLESEYDYNVVIEVGNHPNVQSFKAHSSILYQRSPFFRRKLAGMPWNSQNIKEFRFDNISAECFAIIIRYIYGGFISLENLKFSVILDLIIVADEFSLDKLVKHVEPYLVEHKANWLCLNFSHVYRLSYGNDRFPGFSRFCTEILEKYPDLIFNSRDFTLLPENVLVSILGRNLELEETSVWDCVIKWGISQNQNLPPAVEQWTDNDFVILKTTLKNCLPQIQYSKITGDDIYNKVRPYQKILDQGVWTDMMQRYMAPTQNVTPQSTVKPHDLSIVIPHPKQVSTVHVEKHTEQLAHEISELSLSPFSILLTDEAFAEIAAWIDHRPTTYDTENNPYEFKLIFRGSRDGFTPKEFYNVCNQQTNTVVVLKVNGTGEILGGYNPNPWDKQQYRGWSKTDESFVFSFGNAEPILSRVTHPEQALFESYFDGNGPNFGGGVLRMKDNFREDKSCACMHHKGYERPIRSSKAQFSVDEYEVFKVTNKQGLKIPNMR